ncbi:MAG: site-specific integrase [Candidatus Cloacimonetes bacterium]|nr:site-specific integrase [Candidatus Cloacimonadota bacterium]
MIEEFKEWLKMQNLSMNTIDSYVFSVNQFLSFYKKITKDYISAYKGYLIENYKGKTVNLRIQGLNKYLDFIEKSSLKTRFIKIQQKSVLENVISNADYHFLYIQLKKDNNNDWYFVVRFLGATGCRVSELIEIKAEHVILGHIDIYSKGGKIRRLYIPKTLQQEALQWLKCKNKMTGYIFCNRSGLKLTTRGIAHQLKKLAKDYGVNTNVVYPHSFRHRFAKNFIEKCNDIALLADLMGHNSIETTRIYLRRTYEEQREIIDKVITW